jgi:hypothetical protein
MNTYTHMNMDDRMEVRMGMTIYMRADLGGHEEGCEDGHEGGREE